MARATRATVETVGGEDEQLYVNPFSTTEENSGSGGGGSDTDTGSDTAESGATGESAPYGYLPNGQPRKRRPRQRTSQTEYAATEVPNASRAQLKGLSKAIGLTAQGAFNAIAQVRTMTLGFVPDPTTPNGFITKPDGTPLGAGECWKLDTKDANELGQAWAEVAALYAPPELLTRTATVSAAVTTTAMIVATRLFADVQTQALIKQVNMMRAEGVPLPGTQASPNGAVSYTGMDFSQQTAETSGID